jgi:hypothetical protein
MQQKAESFHDENSPYFVIARSNATKQSSLTQAVDRFVEPVIGRRFAPTRRLAMTDRAMPAR